MRSVISAGIIFILIVVMVVVSTVYVNSFSNEMFQFLYKIENNFSILSYDRLENEMLNFKNFWKKNRTTMSVIFNHQLIEEIDLCLEKLITSVKMRDKAMFEYEKNILKLLLYSFVEQQKLSIGNVM